ncbi:MAG: thioredoxin family protein [Candidatus Aenigmatarchaeota archaeon]
MIIDEKSKEILKEKFEKELKREVEVYFFTDKNKEIPYEELISEHEHNHSEDLCHFCDFMRKFLSELVELSSQKIIVREFDINENQDEAKKYGIEKIPTFLIDPKKGYKIKYIGSPIGEEAWAFIDTIIQVSKDSSNLQKKTKDKLKELKKNVNIKVFVTPPCPYCPYQVFLVNNFAIENKNIEVECIDAFENQEIAEKYDVSAVPHTVINEKEILVGVQTEDKVLEAIIRD